MVRVKEIKHNPHCIASVTVRARKGKSAVQIDNKAYRILGILHRSANTKASEYGCSEGS